MKISFDIKKREATLADRGLDFQDAAEVFAGITFDYEDGRFHYPETRMITAGHLRGRLVILVWTQRGEVRHIISMSAKARGSQPTFGSDLEKVDAHVIAPAEYEEAPELGEEFFERATAHKGGKPLHPAHSSSQQEVTLSIDRDVLERFRATGNDWPKRVNDALRKAAKHL
jgi:uncharacterized protein (DUF4415 family)